MTEPKLRFKADDGNEFPDWNGENVGNLTMELEDYEKLSSGYPLLTSSRAGIMLQSDFRDKITTDNDATVFSVVPYGKCTYRHMSDDDIFHFNINDIAENGLVSREYPVFDTVNGNSLYLLVEYLNSNRRFRKFCREMKKGGTRTRLYYKHLCEFQLFFPSLPEQRKIAEFLSMIDEIIQSTESELTAWQERKKGVMQKIFNREVRFKADDGSEFPEWEEAEIGEICVINPKTEEVEDEFLYMDLGSVDHGDWEEPEVMIKSKAPSRAQRAARVGDVFFQSVRPYNQGHFHYSEKKDKQVVASTGYIQIRMKDCDSGFVYQILYDAHFNQEVSIRCTGSNYPAINADDFSEIVIAYPCVEEQRKIADCLSSLDDVINQIQAELSAWKEFKKGLLQQMFV